MGNFVILIGGPGLFKSCDKAHDQSWTNYIVPLQLAAQKDLCKKQPSEVIHWILYEPPYRKRWLDDSVITNTEKKEDDGNHLHSIRYKAAKKILTKGASSYINRIQTIASSNGITYKGINRPDEFWSYLKSLKDDSITRVWYSGHAGGDGLMLALTHNSNCGASASKRDMILIPRISENSSLDNKFSKSPRQASRFYGCYTDKFAQYWNKVFDVSTAGAKGKIDFGVINRASNIVNVMERLEKEPNGNPDWTVYE